MPTRSLSLFLLLALGSVLSAQQNILVVVADDIGVDMFDFYQTGAETPITPNIDNLINAGTVFTNVWSNPFCSPTRVTLQTGRYGLHTGIGYLIEGNDSTYPMQVEEITLPEMLDAGTGGLYTHAAIGKWHMGRGDSVGGNLAPNMAGYQHFAGTMTNISDYYSWEKVVNGVVSTSTTYATSDSIDEALNWLSTVTQPWFLYLSFNAPHVPYHAPPAHLHQEDLSMAGPPETDKRPYYKAMVEAMDSELGRLFAGIGSAMANTNVIFVGDNGSPGGVTIPPFDNTHGKGTLFDGGINVPLIISGPAVVDGGISNGLANTTDLYATVAELAGVDLASVIPAETTLDSVSLVPYLLDNQAASIREFIYSENFVPNGPTNGFPVPVPPGPLVCQTDVGFGGPAGGATLSVCGDPLADNASADLLVTGAMPLAPAWIFASLSFNPTPFGDGMLVPFPPLLSSALTMNANGEFFYPDIVGGSLFGRISLYVQLIIVDSSKPGGFDFTNTVEIDFLPRNSKAIRNRRFKVISSVNGGPDFFFDLRMDPYEQNNLLEGTPSNFEQANYDDLKAILATLLATP
jgi:arylsulfatase A-like enzyme